MVLALAAAAMAALSTGPLTSALDHEREITLHGGPGTLALFVAGWTLMLLAMMLPTATTLVAAVGRLSESTRDAVRLQVATTAGYLAIWAAVGYLFRAGDVVVHGVLDQVGWVAERPGLVAGVVLVVAGAFQFSSLKHRCLTTCRAPTSFLYRYWRGGKPVINAVRVGAAYGLSCAGCCWALMLVMFAFGVMSATWMVVFGAVMAMEKSTRFGRHLTTPLGIGLLAAGVIVAIRA